MTRLNYSVLRVVLYSDKTIKNNTMNVLVYVLEGVLKLIHPFIPFVTEYIYQELPGHNESIMVENYPEYTEKLNFKDGAKFSDTQRISLKNVADSGKYYCSFILSNIVNYFYDVPSIQTNITFVYNNAQNLEINSEERKAYVV